MDPVKQRGAVKARLTRFEDYLRETKIKIELNSGVLAGCEVIELRKRLLAVQPLLDAFDQFQLQIETASENPESELEHINEFEKKYYQIVSEAESILEQLSGRETVDIGAVSVASGREVLIPGPGSIVSSAVSNSEASLSSNGTPCKGFVKLPTINLPNFNGNAEDWLNFRDLFINLIHENDALTDVHKFHYLRASLTGKAAETIKSLAISSANYNIAWDSVNDRFNNSRTLIHNHIKALFSIEPIANESSSKLRQLTDSVKKNIRALDSLVKQDEQRDAFLIYLINSKLDTNSTREFENKDDVGKSSSFQDLIEFIEKKASLLERIDQKTQKPHAERVSAKSLVATSPVCPLCKGSHSLHACEKFKQFSLKERSDKVKELKVCFNCLAKGHFTGSCKSKVNCQRCKSRHHTLLHQDKVTKSSPEPVSSVTEAIEATVNLSAFGSNQTTVLLSTAVILILDSNGKSHPVRALLDSGSMSNLISESLCKRLKLTLSPVDVQIRGINRAATSINSRCNVEMRSSNARFQLKFSCLVIPHITGNIPEVKVDIAGWDFPANIQLADRKFNIPGKIDILLGASCFWEILCIGQRSLGPGKPILQKTRLGWLVSGNAPSTSHHFSALSCSHSQTLQISQQLTKFWELEEVPDVRVFSREENLCEEHFVKNHRRDSDGRFIVSIPLKEPISKLGDSLEMAKKRFLNLERKLESNPNLGTRYRNFMREYQALGHMSPSSTKPIDVSFFLPHHGVLKESSVTTSLRVVFDGSASTTSGTSLNDLQMIGPTIQSDLFSILLRFRKHSIVISADVEKMYRQVLVEPSQRPLQRILWRNSLSQPIQIFDLNTITYGTASAAFLAIRSLSQVGIECRENYPSISKIILEDFYVDDLLTGTDTIEHAQFLCKTLSHVLSSGCFKLRKWITNEPAALAGLDEADIHPNVLNFGSNEHTRTLGLAWSFKEDNFLYSIEPSSSAKITKRSILSETSQIFDPLGLLSPCIIMAKVILQQLWLEKVSWDESLTQILHSKWSAFRTELAYLNDVKIPRHVICDNSVRIELHGFADASTLAYGGCIYIRSINDQDQVFTRLLCAKSRVAPLKVISVPRLELSAALILTRLMSQVMKAMQIHFGKCFLWSDSTVVLGWLKTPPNLLKTFVANRDAEIQEGTQHAIWRHVPTNSNPADLLSRGVPPKELVNADLWWSGPPWLSLSQEFWPNQTSRSLILPDLKNNAAPSLCL